MESGLDDVARIGGRSESERKRVREGGGGETRVDGSFISGVRFSPSSTLLLLAAGWRCAGPRPNRVVINYQSNYLMI